MKVASNVEIVLLFPFIVIGFLFEGVRVGFVAGRLLYKWLLRGRHV